VDLVEPVDAQVFPPLPGETHEPPGDWQLYYEGKLEANTPGRLPNSEAKYVNSLGLQGLKGPGAWAYYGQEPARAHPSPSNVQAAEEEEAVEEELVPEEEVVEEEVVVPEPEPVVEPAPDAPTKY
jgi:hypothetical protein